MLIDGVEYVKKNEVSISNLEGEKLEVKDLIGGCFYFRTVTYHWTGRVVGIINGNILKLEEAAWIADSGRFHNAIIDGTLDEVEPVEVAFINLDTITDFVPWIHELPRVQK